MTCEDLNRTKTIITTTTTTTTKTVITLYGIATLELLLTNTPPSGTSNCNSGHQHSHVTCSIRYPITEQTGSETRVAWTPG